MKTRTITQKEIKRRWHLLDARDQVLGRLSTQTARWLIGKHKPDYVAHLDCGDYVVVTNARQIKVTGHKSEQKAYYRHSGYPGGFRKTTYQQLMAKDPAEIIRHAVAGMIPKNKLRSGRLARLKTFAGEKHNYQDKFKDGKK